MPRVSIITPCYKSSPYIGRTIESVRAQTITDWEHILVDDGSPDDLVGVVAPYLAVEPRLRLIRQPNSGVCSARNNGFAAASPESAYVLFLDADDCPRPEMLAVLVAYLDAHPAAGMAFCERTHIDENDRPVDARLQTPIPRYVPGRFGVRQLAPEEPRTPFVSIFAYSVIVPSISLLRRSVYMAAGGWDETIRIQLFDDTDLFLRVALRAEVHYVPRDLSLRRLHAQAVTKTTTPAAWTERTAEHFARWLRGEGLSPEQRALVRAAWEFREGRLLPYLYLRWACEALRHRAVLDAGKQMYRGIRQTVRYRTRQGRPPVMAAAVMAAPRSPAAPADTPAGRSTDIHK
jgi:cellulose synthase/poly-beta-1,6-N-acetylglucosamine synthase-like glycosyltransferase